MFLKVLGASNFLLIKPVVCVYVLSVSHSKFKPKMYCASHGICGVQFNI